jgi:hypothetical protein
MLFEDRTPKILKTLQRLLSIRIKSFAKFTPEQQKALCCAIKVGISFLSYIGSSLINSDFSTRAGTLVK